MSPGPTVRRIIHLQGIDDSWSPSLGYHIAGIDLENAPCLSRRNCPGSSTEQFGDELTNELVDWFNQVDATYRADLREINELNFARFDAKLEAAVARLEGGLLARIAMVEARLTRLTVLLWATLAATLIGILRLP